MSVSQFEFRVGDRVRHTSAGCDDGTILELEYEDNQHLVRWHDWMNKERGAKPSNLELLERTEYQIGDVVRHKTVHQANRGIIQSSKSESNTHEILWPDWGAGTLTWDPANKLLPYVEEAENEDKIEKDKIETEPEMIVI